ncbi:pyridoxamine 5'-phosphate oxidase family protein [Rhodocyclus tenuis]|uniref:Pyridoxamine 5'-phosphate oxidase family protein n=1 Tax=Rhodocyclus gracilis TaxID=2929842 RepID=A0ABX0WKG7_9RHOO|nr:pyridoxamine 5'-phosphate oxidase family protein [Rhodocyclus gracilis]NJA90207.1 pyridoxamine 5'-phosphate oxidase family protein [Rhodocyclus gracilis]
MSKYTLAAEIRELLNRADSVKTLALLAEDGSPYVIFVPGLHVDDDGRLVYPEAFEHSQANAHLVRSIWFDQPITAALLAADGRSFQIFCKPYKAVISGPVYEHYYRQKQQRNENFSLSTIWLIDPLSITETSDAVRGVESESDRMPLLHLDRIAVKAVG